MWVKVICGAANNQLADSTDGARLRDRGILYCPDYVVNSGGIINVMAEHAGHDVALVERQIENIPFRLIEILRRADRQNVPASQVADAIAREMTGRT